MLRLSILILMVFVMNIETSLDLLSDEANDSIFEKLELKGVDVKEPLLYGYYFTDNSILKLNTLKEFLIKKDYKYVDLYKTENDTYVLHVEKIEIHSKQTLLELENSFRRLAKEYNIEKYDGWDVGNSDPNKPLLTEKSFIDFLNKKSDLDLFEHSYKLYEKEMNEDAIVALNLCIERKIHLDTCYFRLGNTYSTLGNNDLGIKYLKKSLDINPNYFYASFNLGAIYYDLLDFENSIYYYQIANKLEANNDYILYGIAANQYAIQNYNESEKNCLEALKINPNNSNAKELLQMLKDKKK